MPWGHPKSLDFTVAGAEWETVSGEIGFLGKWYSYLADRNIFRGCD